MRETKTWAVGDIHGSYKALIQVLDRAPLQHGDTIVFLGDYADGWSQVYEVAQHLIILQQEGKFNIICLLGNHDKWFLTWIATGVHPGLTQGGQASVDSYKRNCQESYGFDEIGLFIPEDHVKFWRGLHHYYLDDKGNLFIHGGFNRHKLLKDETDRAVFWWDRDLWHTALSYKAMTSPWPITNQQSSNKYGFKIKDPSVKQIFIGHTTTEMWKTDQPMNAACIWNLDTGAGFVGRLTIMDVDTHDFYQSDPVQELYPDEKGRR